MSNKGSNSPLFQVPQRDVGNYLFNQVARWETNAALSAYSLNSRNLISALNVMATTTTTVSTTFFAVRIKKIIFYIPANATTSSSNGVAEWYAPAGTSLGIKPSSMTAGSVGVASGVKLTMVPPKGTLWENWISINSPGNVTAMIFSMPTNTLIDIHYDAYIDNGDGTLNYATVGATAGNNYRMGLDMLQKSLSSFLVIGYTSV